MPLTRAVVFVTHEDAKILHMHKEEIERTTLHAHHHYTRQHGSDVRAEHEFFGQVCDGLKGLNQVVVAGPHMALAAFRHYVEKHRPELKKVFLEWETVDHPTDPQLAALAKGIFVKHDNLAGTRPLT